MKFDLHNLAFLAGGYPTQPSEGAAGLGFCPGLYVLKKPANWDSSKENLAEYLLGQIGAGFEMVCPGTVNQYRSDPEAAAAQSPPVEVGNDPNCWGFYGNMIMIPPGSLYEGVRIGRWGGIDMLNKYEPYILSREAKSYIGPFCLECCQEGRYPKRDCCPGEQILSGSTLIDVSGFLNYTWKCTNDCGTCNYIPDRWGENQFQSFCPATPSGFSKTFLNTAAEDPCGDFFTQPSADIYRFPSDGITDTKVNKSPDHWMYICQNPKDECIDFRTWDATEARKEEALRRTSYKTPIAPWQVEFADTDPAIFGLDGRFGCCNFRQTEHPFYDEFPPIAACWVDYVNDIVRQKYGRKGLSVVEDINDCLKCLRLNSYHHGGPGDCTSEACTYRGLEHLFTPGPCAKVAGGPKSANCCEYDSSWGPGGIGTVTYFCPEEDGWKARCTDEWNKCQAQQLIYGCEDNRDMQCLISTECYADPTHVYPFASGPAGGLVNGGVNICTPNCEGQITTQVSKNAGLFFVPHPPTGTTEVNGCPQYVDFCNNYRFRYEHVTWELNPAINFPTNPISVDCDDPRILDIIEHKDWILREKRKETRTFMLYSGDFSQLITDHGTGVFITGMEIPLPDEKDPSSPWRGFMTVDDTCNMIGNMNLDSCVFQVTNDPTIPETNDGGTYVLISADSCLGPFPSYTKAVVDYYKDNDYVAQSNWICLRDNFMVTLPPVGDLVRSPRRAQMVTAGAHVITTSPLGFRNTDTKKFKYWWLDWMAEYNYIYDDTYNGSRISDLYFQLDENQYEFNYGLCGILTGDSN